MSKKLFALMLSLLLSLSCISCLAEAAPQLEPQHSEVALAMQSYLEEDPELMTLMEKSIAPSPRNQSRSEYKSRGQYR